jgi:hypothetical protein
LHTLRSEGWSRLCKRWAAAYLFDARIEQFAKEGHDSGLLASPGGPIEQEMREIASRSLTSRVVVSEQHVHKAKLAGEG